jgi:cytochrome P450
VIDDAIETQDPPAQRGQRTEVVVVCAPADENAVLTVENPQLMDTAIHEFLRWVSPVRTMARTVTQDTELRGQAIAKGDYLILAYGSGNRDEDAWSNPEMFDVTRAESMNIAFGYGEHMCIGANLARLEAKTVIGSFLTRFPNLWLWASPNDCGRSYQRNHLATGRREGLASPARILSTAAEQKVAPCTS